MPRRPAKGGAWPTPQSPALAPERSCRRRPACCWPWRSTLAAGLADRAAAAPTDAVFTVGNYPVEARADNAVAAKDKALADGQQAAFRSLLKRLVPVTAYARIKRLAGVKAGDLVDGFKVRSERNSSTDYIASLDFTFQSKGVRDLLRREGIPFTDEQAPALTVVPVWRAAAAGAAKGEAAWTNALEGPRPRARADPRQAAGAQEGDRARHRRGLGRRRRQRHPHAGCRLWQRARPPRRCRARRRGRPAQRHAERPRRRRRLYAQAGLPRRCRRSRLCQRAGRRDLARHPRGPLEGHQVAQRRGGGGGGCGGRRHATCSLPWSSAA